MSTEQQSVFMILSTDRENQYPKYLKLSVIPADNKEFISRFFYMKAKVSPERVLNTDGKTTFGGLSKEMTVKSEKIVYSERNHRLKWQGIIAGNIQNNITGIYHGVPKRSLPLFLQEQEWRFNHRYIGKHVMEKVAKYIAKSFPVTDRMIIDILDISKPYFSTCV